MVQLQSRIDDLTKAGVNVVAISYDSPAVLSEFAKRHKVTFPLLSDTTSKAITDYGIKNDGVPSDSATHGIPHPGTFLIDQNKVVRAKLFYSVRQRHTAEELLEQMKTLSL